MIVNTSYLGLGVGTSVFTSNILEALPEARTLRLSTWLMQPTAASFWAKRVAELGLSTCRQCIVHPYWSTDISRGHIISVLDLVQFSGATRLERHALELSAQRAAAVLVLSESVARDIHWRDPSAIFLAPPVPERSWYDRPVATSAGRGDPLRIAYFGGWHPRKSMPAFLSSVARSRLAGSVEIHCTGRAPTDSPPNLRVVSHGDLTTDEAISLVDGSDLTVYPSVAEGYGLPIVESLLRHRTVLCRDLAVYREFAQPGVLHVPESWSDPEAIADAIERAASAPPLARENTLIEPNRAASVQNLRRSLLSAVEATR